MEEGPKGLHAASVSKVSRANTASVSLGCHPGVVDRGFLFMAGHPAMVVCQALCVARGGSR
jgi:hypothetical protein